jgi:hypothetical protein
MENIDTGSLFMFGSLIKNTDSNYFLYFMILNFFMTGLCKYIDKTKFESDIRDRIQNITKYFFYSPVISIEFVSHNVEYTNGYSDKALNKNIFSPYFLGILHYVKLNKKNIDGLKNTTEILINKISDVSRPYWQRDESKEDKFLLIPENNEQICLDKKLKIYLKISVTANVDEKINDKSYTMKLFTYTDQLSFEEQKNKLNQFVEDKKKEYEMISEKKDNNQYIFEYKGNEKCDDEVSLKYNEFIMEHNKNLKKNIFFEGKQQLLDYIEPFIYDKDETFNKGEESYINAGMTFKAGLLFYGSPGCGKTSTVKGILKHCNRHAIIINLSNIKSNDEIESVFRNRRINGKKYSGKELCFILEDCDATKLSSLKERNDVPIIFKKDKSVSDNNDVVTMSKILEDSKGFDLSCFLNVLDGIIELHGVMIIMTSNHPEKLDEALIRPGRIDFKYEFKKANKELIMDMLKLKYNKSDDDLNSIEEIQNIKDYILSPAQIQSICFKNKKIEDCVKNIILDSQN